MVPTPKQNRRRTQAVPMLMNGISNQPPTVRLPNQVADAENVNFSVVDGMTRRPGSWIQQHLSDGLLPAANNRMHAIIRDDVEEYLVVHNRTSGGTVIRVLELSINAWANVTISADAQTYLDSASPDEFRFRTIVDVTLIINTEATLGYSAGPSYAVTASWRDFDVMVSHTPADDTYHQTTQDGSEPEGFYHYDVGGVTFATIQFAEISGAANATATGIWNDSAGTQRGFRIRFRYFDTGAVVAATWDSVARTITKTGEFAGYTLAGTQYINVTGGTGVTAGFAEIESRVSDDAVKITAGAAALYFGANNADTTFDGIATQHDVSLGVINASDMYGVAAAIQETLQDAGASDALVGWTSTGVSSGYFTITSPYRSTHATIYPPVSAGLTTDLSAAGEAFDGTAGYTITAGTGSGSLSFALEDRWESVISSGQPDAVLDPTTMPVKLVRDAIGLTGEITSATVANPTVITSAAHGLTSGDTVEITGSDSNPTIDGTHVVTVTGTNTFTVPVNVNVQAGTVGTWIRRAEFTIDVVDWSDRASGNGTTNPLPVLWKEARTINDARYWRGRLWFLGDEWAVSTQAEDLFNFWIEDVNSLSDSDPVKVQLASDQVTIINYGQPIRDSMILFTKAGRQFELFAPDAMTPSTVRAKPLTTYRTLPCQPEPMDPAVYFVAESSCGIQLLEYVYDEIALPSDATDVSEHVPELMPMQVDVPAAIGAYTADHSEVRRLCVSDEHGMVFILRKDKVTDGEVFSQYVYVYRTRMEGGRKVQSAWTRWKFAGSRGIHDMAVIGNYLYLLVHCGTESPPDFFIAKVSIPAETDCSTDEPPSPVDQPDTTT